MYIVLTSIINSGTPTTTTNEIESIYEAKRIYHATLAAAYAQSDLEYVLCMIINGNGIIELREEYSLPVTNTVTYNVNGGTGSIAPVVVNEEEYIDLDNGASLTPPTGKVFAGWATYSSATAPNVSSPYMPTADITLYAVWVNA